MSTIKKPGFRFLRLAKAMDLPRAEKVTLIVLATYAGNSEVVYPGVEKLAWECASSPRTVQRALRGLEAKGVLKRKGKHPRLGTYRYELMEAAMQSLCPALPPGLQDCGMDSGPEHEVPLQAWGDTTTPRSGQGGTGNRP
jgi:hypothetical protein